MTPTDYRELFLAVCRALPFDALLLKPREKMLALLLAWDSFALGREFGPMDHDAWRLRFSEWRSNEIKDLLTKFCLRGWMAIDLAEGTFRLKPAEWPGWSNVAALQQVQPRLEIETETDLNRELAKYSQDVAVRVARFNPMEVSSQALESAKISQSHGRGSACENFAGSSPPSGFQEKRPDSGTLRSLRVGPSADLPADRVSLNDLKNRHKGIKPLMDFESLRTALLAIEIGNEETAYLALCGILGGVVMEGGDLDAAGHERIGDGGKWRNRWRTNRHNVHRVMASLVELIKESRVLTRGGKSETLWQEMASRPGPISKP